MVECEKLVLFGVHTCDIAGIQCLNIAMAEKPADHNYEARKNEILIIGLECSAYCDKHASCALMNTHMPGGGYDIMLTDLGDYYMAHANTQAGNEIIEQSGLFKHAEPRHMQGLDEFRAKKREIFKPEVDVDAKKLPEVFAKTEKSPVWKNLGDKCLACGNCTNVCPTCYCFDVKDELNLDLKTGRRVRVWDSCQSAPSIVSFNWKWNEPAEPRLRMNLGRSCDRSAWLKFATKRSI